MGKSMKEVRLESKKRIKSPYILRARLATFDKMIYHIEIENRCEYPGVLNSGHRDCGMLWHHASEYRK